VGGKGDTNLTEKTSALEAKIFGLNLTDKNTNDFYLNFPNTYLDFRKNNLWKFGMVKNQDDTKYSQDARWVYITAKTNKLSTFSDSAAFPNEPGMAYVAIQPKIPVDLDLLGPAKNNIYIYADLILKNNSDFFALLDPKKSVQAIPLYKNLNSVKRTMIQIYNEVTLSADTSSPKDPSSENQKRDLTCRLRVELSYFASADFRKPAVKKVVFGKPFNLTEKDTERLNFWITQTTLEGNFLKKKFMKPEFKIEIGSNQGLSISVESFQSLFTLFDHHLVGESNPLLPGGQVLVQNNFEDFSLQFGSQNSCLPGNQKNPFCDSALARCSSPVETGNS